MRIKIKDIENNKIKNMALLNASKDFHSYSKEDLGELELVESFYFHRAEFPKGINEGILEDFWHLVNEKEESEALLLLDL